MAFSTQQKPKPKKTKEVTNKPRKTAEPTEKQQKIQELEENMSCGYKVHDEFRPKGHPEKPSVTINTENSFLDVKHPFLSKNNPLMRPFDPKDPNNKYRTYENVLKHANNQHLNPGESAHFYYIEADGTLHGFIAVGNLNDSLPHLIYSDSDTSETTYHKIQELKKAVDNTSLEKVSELVDEFKMITDGLADAIHWIDVDEKAANGELEDLG